MIILHNARIYTLDPHSPSATALSIRDGKILAVGNDEDVLNQQSSQSQVINLHGKTVWPGLTDAHIHLEHYATSLQKIDCETDSLEECLRRVEERARQAPPGAWILGHGWNQNSWDEGFGSAADLDRVAPQHPVYLTAKSLHAGWANTKAMQIAGIQPTTPEPVGGSIQRGAGNEPTGILFESAMDLIADALPTPTTADVAEAIDKAQPILWKMGITSVHDFDRQRCFSALQDLHLQDKLRLRVVKSLPAESLEHIIAIGLRSGFGDDFLRLGSIKLFVDGALGPHTAAMLQPYEGSQDDQGMLFMDKEEIFEVGQQAAAAGLSLAVHAIGDAANHAVLDAFTQLRHFEAEQKLPQRRHRIEHVQLLHPDDLSRLAEIGVVASMQPVHATSDMDAADRHWGARAQYSYAWRSLMSRNTTLAFGSDAPVESPNPFWGLHAAVTRQRKDSSPGPDGWYPEQCLSLVDALAAFTTGPAFTAGLENRLGMLSPGYHADLIVLKDDPFHQSQADLHKIQPVATMVAGEWVWETEL